MPFVFRVRDLRLPGVSPLAFDVAPGRILTVSGASGSGKTRLLRALADLDHTPGDVAWEGVDRAAIPAPRWRRRVGLLPAEPRFWAATVRGHFPSDVGGVEAEFDRLGLDPELADADPARLSTGERARVAVLRLLARRPRVLLLDEPTANLDRRSRERVVDRLTRYVGERPAAALWVTHLDEELALADRTLRLPSGRIGSGSEGEAG